MDNLAEQVDEIEALVSIYNDDWQSEDIENRSYSVRIPDGDNFVKLYLKLPLDYPSRSPPQYEISAPHLNLAKKNRLCTLLDEVYSSFIGETVLYQWIERIREDLQPCTSPEQTDDNDNEIIENEIQEEIFIPQSDYTENHTEDSPRIHHGEVILDRKSSFQGHAAAVYSISQVKQVLRTLLENRKIEQATHNIYAYRIFQEDRNTFVQDCEDDGESQAGGRLLHFLQIVEAKNVLVVVSRWYGGIHLGPDRFRHINNAARQVLQSAEFIGKNREHKK